MDPEAMLSSLLVAAIRLYQLTLSRLFGRVCRFEPSCSRYAVACLESHGALRGGVLALVRLCKCHPFHPGGYDPPPPASMTSGARSRTPQPLPTPGAVGSRDAC